MEKEYSVKILATRQVTHDVKEFRVEKPKGYVFTPGQATDVSINHPDWKDRKNPFTFTGLNDDPFLQFTIKGYPSRHGVTDRLHQLQSGDELIVRDVWGAIEYRGPGVFLAGGAGITPFLAIFRQLHREHRIAGNSLFFSNKTEADIIEHEELIAILGDGATFILTEEKTPGYLHSRIDKAFLKEHISNFKQPFYVCGPDQMVKDLSDALQELGASAESVVFEK
jgi:ferredoxin-NADP reductase